MLQRQTRQTETLTVCAQLGRPHRELMRRWVCRTPPTTFLSITSVPTTAGLWGLGYFRHTAWVTVSQGWLWGKRTRVLGGKSFTYHLWFYGALDLHFLIDTGELVHREFWAVLSLLMVNCYVCQKRWKHGNDGKDWQKWLKRKWLTMMQWLLNVFLS